MKQLEVIYKKIEEIKPYKKNAKKHPPEQVEQIKNSIKEFGFADPIGIWHGEIVEGHGRYIAAKELGLTEVPVIVLDDLTDEQRRAYALAHNQLTMSSGFDIDILNEELANILDLDMASFGFDDVEDISEEVEEDEYEEEPPTEPKAKRGDLYKLGDHVLMCGDSTNRDDLAKLMGGTVADLVFTDPPYGMGKETIENDNLYNEKLLAFNKKWIPLSLEFLKGNGSWYCWGMDEPLMDIYSDILKPLIKSVEITFRNLLTWDKGHGQGQLSEDFRMYATADEKCLFIMKGQQEYSNNASNYFDLFDPVRTWLKEAKQRSGLSTATLKEACGQSPSSGCHWFDKSQWMCPTREEYETWQKLSPAFDRSYDDIQNELKEIYKKYQETKEKWYETRAFFDNTHDNQNNVWHFDRAGKEERTEHETPKPLALCARAIKSSSRPGEIVLDLFGGSGSTMIACEQLGRKCYVMEIEPRWVDVIIDRWEKHTGKKAEKFIL